MNGENSTKAFFSAETQSLALLERIQLSPKWLGEGSLLVPQDFYSCTRPWDLEVLGPYIPPNVGSAIARGCYGHNNARHKSLGQRQGYPNPNSKRLPVAIASGPQLQETGTTQVLYRHGGTGGRETFSKLNYLQSVGNHQMTRDSPVDGPTNALSLSQPSVNRSRLQANIAAVD